MISVLDFLGRKSNDEGQSGFPPKFSGPREHDFLVSALDERTLSGVSGR